MLSKYRGTDAGLERVIGRLVTIRGAAQLSLVLRYRTRDVTKNVPLQVAAGEGRIELRYGDLPSRLYFWSRWLMGVLAVIGIGFVIWGPRPQSPTASVAA